MRGHEADRKPVPVSLMSGQRAAAAERFYQDAELIRRNFPDFT